VLQLQMQRFWDWHLARVEDVERRRVEHDVGEVDGVQLRQQPVDLPGASKVPDSKSFVLLCSM
jgi:hypothetical protein